MGISVGDNFDYRGKKLVTIGDSITYGRTWQDRLCELTGLTYTTQKRLGEIMRALELKAMDTYY